MSRWHWPQCPDKSSQSAHNLFRWIQHQSLYSPLRHAIKYNRMCTSFWKSLKDVLFLNKDVVNKKTKRGGSLSPNKSNSQENFFLKETISVLRVVKRILQFLFYICHIKDSNKNASASKRMLRCLDSTFIKHCLLQTRTVLPWGLWGSGMGGGILREGCFSQRPYFPL